MKVLYVQVLLEKNEHFSTPTWVYPWELPVFAAVHRNSGVRVLDRRTFNKRVAPNAHAEYDRLAQRYKGPEGSDLTYVSSVYGHGDLGVKKLHEAMEEAAEETARVAAEEAIAPPVPVPATNENEFESPFGEVSELAGPVIETQADLRNCVGGGEDSEPVAISQ